MTSFREFLDTTPAPEAAQRAIESHSDGVKWVAEAFARSRTVSLEAQLADSEAQVERLTALLRESMAVVKHVLPKIERPHGPECCLRCRIDNIVKELEGK